MDAVRLKDGGLTAAVCAVVVGVYILLMNISKAITLWLFGNCSEIVQMTVKEGLYAVSAILLLWLTGGSLFRKIKVRNNKVRHDKSIGFTLACSFMIAIIVRSKMSLADCADCRIRPINEIVLFILLVIFIGIAEESVFRGIVAEKMICKYGNSVKGKYYAALVSGLLFGAVHLVNIFSANIVGVLCQSFGAFVAGVILSDIYYRYRSIWIMIFMHTAIDFANLIGWGLYDTSSPVEIVSSYKPVLFIPYILILVVWLIKSRYEIFRGINVM